MGTPPVRMTRQRQIILDELRNTRTHPTADEVYERVRLRLPRVSLGTVYRNLEMLSQSGVIQKLELAGSRRRFDGSVDNHYHISCVRCGKVEDVALAPLETLEESARAISKFQIVGHRLKFLGVCPSCGAKNPDAEQEMTQQSSTPGSTTELRGR
ncbi:MAG: transcriptional repressor [bacterium]